MIPHHGQAKDNAVLRQRLQLLSACGMLPSNATNTTRPSPADLQRASRAVLASSSGSSGLNLHLHAPSVSSLQGLLTEPVLASSAPLSARNNVSLAQIERALSASASRNTELWDMLRQTLQNSRVIDSVLKSREAEDPNKAAAALEAARAQARCSSTSASSSSHGMPPLSAGVLDMLLRRQGTSPPAVGQLRPSQAPAPAPSDSEAIFRALHGIPPPLLRSSSSSSFKPSSTDALAANLVAFNALWGGSATHQSTVPPPPLLRTCSCSSSKPSSTDALAANLMAFNNALGGGSATNHSTVARVQDCSQKNTTTVDSNALLDSLTSHLTSTQAPALCRGTSRDLLLPSHNTKDNASALDISRLLASAGGLEVASARCGASRDLLLPSHTTMVPPRIERRPNQLPFGLQSPVKEPTCDLKSKVPVAPSKPAARPLKKFNKKELPKKPEADAAVSMALGIEQDINWLSECQCVLRSEFIEITQARRKEFNVLEAGTCSTNTAEEYMQVGIRCRFCAHLPSGQRPSRSSAFPSSIKQLYQSFTMMQRDHFLKCTAIPLEKRQRLEALRKTKNQGACDSKQYWIYAAQTLGLFDTPRGIEMTPDSQEAGRKMPLFGVDQDMDCDNHTKASNSNEHGPLVHASDAPRVHPFLYLLLQQLEIVELLPSEQVGKRKSLPIGFCGLGCRYCSPKGRLGFSRAYPLRRRTLTTKLDDMVAHLQRCSLCPSDLKSRLAEAKKDGQQKCVYQQHPELLDRIWKQLDREGDGTPAASKQEQMME